MPSIGWRSEPNLDTGALERVQSKGAVLDEKAAGVSVRMAIKAKRKKCLRHYCRTLSLRQNAIHTSHFNEHTKFYKR